MPFIAIALALMVAIGGGASVAANGSLPGDVLYPIKINFNERVEQALSFSAEAKADEHLEAIEARHEEAKKLEAEGKLDAETKASLNANIEAHAEALLNALAQVKAHGDEHAIAELEAKLDAALKAAAASGTSVNVQGNANANANANLNSNSQGSATGTMNSASTSGQGGVKVDDQNGIHVEL